MKINRDINIIDYLKTNIQHAAEIYQTQANNIFKKLSETNVHDFRVCIRRLLSQSSLINDLNPIPHYPELKAELKSQVKLFNDLRDNQVQILKTQSLAYEYLALYKLYHYLIDQEHLKVKQLKENIKLIDYNHTLNLYFKNLNYIDETINPNNFYQIIDNKMNLVIERFKLSNESDLSTIHKTRLAFKKFRYTIEFLSPIFKYNEESLLKLKNFQTTMGQIQDNVVYLNYFTDWQNKYNKLSNSDFELIKLYLLEERKQLINDYFNNFNEIYTFWETRKTNK